MEIGGYDGKKKQPFPDRRNYKYYRKNMSIAVAPLVVMSVFKRKQTDNSAHYNDRAENEEEIFIAFLYVVAGKQNSAESNNKTHRRHRHERKYAFRRGTVFRSCRISHPCVKARVIRC